MTRPIPSSGTLLRCLRKQSRSVTSSSKSSKQEKKQWEETGDETKSSQPQQITVSSPCRPLPLSPYMDAATIAARRRTPKEKPRGLGTPLQQELAKNPYAQALATPMRQCQLTRMSIPKFFLQDFELVLHPSTNTPHFLPRSLAMPYNAQKHAKDTTNPTSQTESHDGDEKVTEAVNENQFENYETQEVKSESTTSGSSGGGKAANDAHPKELHTASRGQRTYVLSRHLLIDRITRKPEKGQKNRYLQGHNRFPPDLFHATRQWRPDMADWVLELRRRRIVEMLCYLASLKKGYLVACGSKDISPWDDAKAKKQVGALLWLGKQIPPSVSDTDSLEATGEKKGRQGVTSTPAQEPSPPEFATLYIGRELQKKSKVPVHSLPDLLGREKVSQLHDQYPKLFSGEIVAIKNRRLTVTLQMQLWKLQGYLARHEALITEQDAEDFDEDFDERSSDSRIGGERAGRIGYS